MTEFENLFSFWVFFIPFGTFFFLSKNTFFLIISKRSIFPSSKWNFHFKQLFQLKCIFLFIKKNLLAKHLSDLTKFDVKNSFCVFIIYTFNWLKKKFTANINVIINDYINIHISNIHNIKTKLISDILFFHFCWNKVCFCLNFKSSLCNSSSSNNNYSNYYFYDYYYYNCNYKYYNDNLIITHALRILKKGFSLMLLYNF